MHISNGTSVINDEDYYGHQTVLYPSNETTVGEEGPFQQTVKSQEGTNAEPSLNETNIDSTVTKLPRRSERQRRPPDRYANMIDLTIKEVITLL